ncbi:SRPBCC family protein [Inquilinus sp. NPDC058860]|uniref:SRPBCC family protein n=1 Tax=Inquilinus sp. NPDC058860 TaxID=3346652 RepID=UPI0036C53735
MIRVTTSSVINAPVETLWQAIRDFNALPDWHPAIASSKVEDGGSPDRIGCVRSMELAGGGGTIREKLLTLSDSEHSVTYAILAAPMPVENYVATLRLLPVTDGNRSFAEWTAEFDVSAENEAAMRKLIGQGVFQTGFDSLKQRFGG